MQTINNSISSLNFPRNWKNFKETHSTYKKQDASMTALKPLRSDEVTFKGNETKIDKKKALEWVKNGARIYHAADGTYKFVDGNGKILQATKDLQDAIDSGNFANVAIQEAANELAEEGAKEAVIGAIEAGIAACTIQ